MSEKVDQFVKNLRDHLNEAEGRLEKVKASIGTAKSETKASVENKIAEAKAAAGAQKARMEEAQAKMKANLEEKKATTEDKVATWMRDRNVNKLERRASWAEDDAALAIWVAVDAIDTANVLTLDAIAARIDADEVAATAGTG
jgi:hypothetical protein